MIVVVIPKVIYEGVGSSPLIPYLEEIRLKASHSHT